MSVSPGSGTYPGATTYPGAGSSGPLVTPEGGGGGGGGVFAGGVYGNAVPVNIPHFRYPFVIGPQGAAVVEQDSLDEIVCSVQMIVSCPQGACSGLPDYGVPDMTFSAAPPDTTALLAAVKLWEPRADESAVVQALDGSGADYGVQITPSVTGTGQ